MRKERRLQGYPYYNAKANLIRWWDTYGDDTFSGVWGEWILIPDDEVGLYFDSANMI